MRIGGDAVRILLCLIAGLIAVGVWLIFAALQEEDSKMLIREELDELVNEMLEREDYDEG